MAQAEVEAAGLEAAETLRVTEARLARPRPFRAYTPDARRGQRDHEPVLVRTEDRFLVGSQSALLADNSNTISEGADDCTLICKCSRDHS